MTIEYDPNIIQVHASELYSHARSVVAGWTFIGFLAGGAATVSLADQAGILSLIALLLVTTIGFLIGKSRAAHLKLQAQLALCQVQIENNTRKGQL